jgi:hypothetical protein
VSEVYTQPIFTRSSLARRHLSSELLAILQGIMQSSYPQLVLLRARRLDVLGSQDRVVVDDGICADMRLGVCVELLGLGGEVEVDGE